MAIAAPGKINLLAHIYSIPFRGARGSSGRCSVGTGVPMGWWVEYALRWVRLVQKWVLCTRSLLRHGCLEIGGKEQISGANGLGSRCTLKYPFQMAVFIVKANVFEEII